MLMLRPAGGERKRVEPAGARVRYFQAGSTATHLSYLLALVLALGWPGAANAQSNTRLLLMSGWGVPGHQGFVFGPFSGLTMNGIGDIAFQSSLRSAKLELRAVIRSRGVTFTTVAFEGLRSPVRNAFYESFSAPSLNDSGLIAFTATLKKDSEEIPASAVIRLEGNVHKAVVTAGESIPGEPGSVFQEFSAPLITSTGNVLFGARTGGKRTGTGLFLWTPRGLRALAVPSQLLLSPADLLQPAFFYHDEAVFVGRGTRDGLFADQFFRALAVKNFQGLTPPPDPAEVAEILPARVGETPLKMLMVVMDGDQVESAALVGAPAQAVQAKQVGAAPAKPVGRILAQAMGSRGNILSISAPADQESDIGLYCYCDGQLVRLTSAEEFIPITQGGKGSRIAVLASDAQETAAYIVPGDQEEASAIYVTSIP
jgi:hypothetical protein